MARKSKYNDDFPLLAEGYARDGLNDEQIANKLGVHVATFYKYQQEYDEFHNAVKRGKAPVDIMVENALLKKALGFKETVRKTRITRDGQKVEYDDDIYFPPDVGAIVFWLKNRKRTNWKDKFDGSTDDSVIEKALGKIKSKIKNLKNEEV